MVLFILLEGVTKIIFFLQRLFTLAIDVAVMLIEKELFELHIQVSGELYDAWVDVELNLVVDTPRGFGDDDEFVLYARLYHCANGGSVGSRILSLINDVVSWIKNPSIILSI